ncbi:MAG TPA: hypothetical protein VN132_12660, partial [Bdellovibrio sp.]|nr:hypothetical protein [Bdellovibrio sp.]
GDGVALWDESLVSASDIHSFYEKLPSSTMIRAIHIHCYAGAAMSGPNSEIPLGDTQKIQSFLDKKYPSNVCGLSLSDSDEIGQYRGWAQDEWHKDLQKKSLSLSELKAKLEADTTFFPSVMLTSDYFLRDLRNSLCKLSSVGESAEKTKTEGSVCRECSANKNMTLAKNVEDLKHTLCEMPSKDSDVFGHFDYVNKLYNELESMKFEVNREFIKTKFPDLYNNVLKSVKEMDAIKQQIAQEKDPKQIDTLVKKLDAVRSDYPTRYHNYLSSVEDDPDFVSFFNKTATPDWIKERQNKFPTLARVVSVNPDYFASKGMKEYLKFIEEGEEKRLAYERAKLVSSANTYRKSITDVLFSDPQLAPLKERYERIVQCENSSLN